MPRYTGGHLSLVEKGTTLLVVLSFLGGRFSLARLASESVDLGWGGSSAVWLTGLLILSSMLVALERPPDRVAAPSYAAWSWSLAVIGLHLWIILSSLWSDYPLREVIESAAYLYLSAIIFGISAWFFFRDRWIDKFTYLSKVLVCCASIYAVAGLATGNLQRMSAFGGGPNVYVRIMGIGIGCALYLATSLRTLPWLLPLPVFLIGAVLTGSRGGMVAIVAMLIVFSHYFWFAKRLRWQMVLMAALGVLGLIGLMSIWPAFGEFVQQRFVELTLQQRYLSSRDRLFTAAWDIFLGQPHTGVGLDGFSLRLLRTQGYAMYPHNLVLQLAAETGVVGLGMFAALIWALVRRWFRPRGLMSVSALAIGILFLTASMFSGDFYDARMTWFFLALYMLPAEPDAPILPSVQTDP